MGGGVLKIGYSFCLSDYKFGKPLPWKQDIHGEN